MVAQEENYYFLEKIFLKITEAIINAIKPSNNLTICVIIQLL
jgi:hypothetical protein